MYEVAWWTGQCHEAGRKAEIVTEQRGVRYARGRVLHDPCRVVRSAWEEKIVVRAVCWCEYSTVGVSGSRESEGELTVRDVLGGENMTGARQTVCR